MKTLYTRCPINLFKFEYDMCACLRGNDHLIYRTLSKKKVLKGDLWMETLTSMCCLADIHSHLEHVCPATLRLFDPFHKKLGLWIWPLNQGQRLSLDQLLGKHNKPQYDLFLETRLCFIYCTYFLRFWFDICTLRCGMMRNWSAIRMLLNDEHRLCVKRDFIVHNVFLQLN